MGCRAKIFALSDPLLKTILIMILEFPNDYPLRTSHFSLRPKSQNCLTGKGSEHRLEWMIRMGGLQVVLDGIEKDNIRFSYDFS